VKKLATKNCSVEAKFKLLKFVHFIIVAVLLIGRWPEAEALIEEGGR
jgi:hypothetical protein